VLVIALIVVTLLSSGFNVAGPNQAESEAYWASASPIKIVNAKMVSGTLVLGVQNTGNMRIYLTGLSVSGTELNLFHYYSADNFGNTYCNSTATGYTCDIYLQVGKVEYLAAQTAPTCPANGMQEFNDVVFTYRTKGISDFKFIGDKPLVVPCSGVSANMTLVTFYGFVTDVFGNPIPNATVVTSRTGFTDTATTNAMGAYQFNDMVPGAYALQASRQQLYYNNSLSATLIPTAPVRVDFALQSVPVISFMPPTPTNATTIPDITINASILNSTLPLNNFIFNWNGTNYTIYDGSLVLDYNFDDVSSIGDTAGKVTDLSPQGNNGTVYGNTALLLHMDENAGSVAYDESVNGNNGTCYNMGGTGVTNCSWTAGKSGTGIEFDGVDDYAIVTDAYTLDGMSKLTLEAWIKPTGSQSDGRFICKYGSNSGEQDYYFKRVSSNRVQAYLVINGTINTPAANTNTVYDDVWSHVVAVYDGTDIRIYVNGVLSNTPSPATGSINAGSNHLSLGAFYDDGNVGAHFKGTLDEVVIANQSISASEVLARYNSGRARHADWDPSGKWDGAMKFDGIDDYVNAGTLGSFGSTMNVFSVGVWMKTSDTRNLRAILKQINNGNSNVFGIEPNRGVLDSSCNLNETATGQTLFYVRDNTGKIFARNINNNIYDGSWHHVFWRMLNASSNSMEVYIDGVNQTLFGPCSQSPNSFVDFDHAIYVGAANNRGTTQGFLNGSIDEVRIWNRALSTDEISQQYYSSLNKYALDKWLFQSTQQYVYNGTYSFYASAKPIVQNPVFSETRTNMFNSMIMFTPPTPDNGASVLDINLNASIANLTMRQFTFSANSTNFTAYDDSLVLAYSFDDVFAIGDTAGKVVDVSRYGNNGTVYGNTALLLHMDEGSGNSTLDESRFANNATCYNMNGGSGVTNCNWVTGRNGNGIIFDGVDDSINLSYANSTNIYNHGTVIVWFKRSGNATGYQGIYQRFNGSAKGLQLYIYNTGGFGAYTDRGFASNYTLADDNWHQYAAVSEGTVLKTYVDGNIVGYNTSVTFFDIPTPVIHAIGYYSSGKANGTIDEVGIYNRSLSASEVLAHYNAGKAKHADWDADGKFGSAMKFDGVNDYVVTNPVNQASYTDKLTVSAWVKRVSTSVGVLKIYVSTQVSANGFELYQGNMAPGIPVYAAIVKDSGAWATCFNYTPTGFADDLNTWAHLAMTYNGSTLVLYRNGVAIGSDGCSGNIQFGSGANYSVGGLYGGYAVNGSIDEVRIWNRSLSAAEIQQQYYSSLNKYAPDKWFFSYNVMDPVLQNSSFQAYVQTSGGNSLVTDFRRLSTYNKILFAPPTPSNGTTAYDISINATLTNVSLRQMNFTFNGTNYSFYDDSLVLAYNFDDASAVGDTASKAVDVSLYGNNGTIYGNTVGLWHFDEADGKTALDESRFANNGTIYGNTRLLLHFDENGGNVTYDESAYKNNGTCYNMGGTGVTNCNWTAGKSGTGVQFDGVDDSIKMTSSSFNRVNGQPLTIMAWIKLASIKNGNVVTNRYDGQNYTWILGVTPAGQIILFTASGPNTAYGTLTTGVWTHITAIQDETGVQSIYQNGVLKGTSSGNGYRSATPNTLSIAGYGTSTGENFNGTIDEVGVYSKALNATEVLARYNAGKAKHADWTVGKSGTGVQFDGVDDYTSGSLAGITATKRWAIEMWFKSNDTVGYLIDTRTAEANGNAIYIQGTNDVHTYMQSSPVIQNYKYNQTMFNNIWNHIVYQRDGDNLTSVYLNGVYLTPESKPTDADISNIYSNWSSFTLGARHTKDNVYLNGDIDEVGIYNRSLSTTEVLAHYNAGKAKHADWDSDGKWNSAMKFDGVDDYVNVKNEASLNFGTENFSIGGWVKPTSFGVDNTEILSKVDSTWPTRQIVLEASPSGRLRFVVRGTGGTTGENDLMTANNVALNTWSYVTAVRTGNTNYLYINGALSASQTAGSSNDVSSNLNLKIGVLTYNGLIRFFNGSIDEVRVWNRSLSAAEVSQQYYGSLNKYAPDKWVFLSNQTGIYSGNYSYQVWALTNYNNTLSSENRSNEYYTRITFFSPTPDNASALFAGSINLNASIVNTTLTDMKFNWNGTNYSFYDDSLVLAYNFDDVPAIGDTGQKAVDVSRYGNNGTIASPNTALLLHFDENDSGIATDYSGNGNTGYLYGDTAGLWHLDEGRGPTAFDSSGYGNHGQLSGSNTLLLLHMDEGTGGVVYDDSAYGNNGTISGASWTSSGKSGNALSFDGQNDYISAGSFSSIVGASAITGEAWIYPRTVAPAYQEVFVKGTNDILMRIDSGGILGVTVNNAGGVYTAAGTIIANQWQHIAYTWNTDDDIIRIYVNGIQVKSETKPTTTVANTGNLYVGVWSTPSSEWFNGTIDEVGIYSKAISASEVLDHYNTGRAKHADFVQGKSGTGLQFDGVDDIVNLSTSTSFRQSSEITYSFWAKIPTGSSGGQVMGAGCAGGQGYGGVTIFNTGTPNGLAFWWTPTTPQSDTYIASNESLGTTNDTWNHYAIVVNFTGKTRAMYVNGRAINTSTYSSPTNWTPKTSYNAGRMDSIGGRFINSWYYFNGSLDEVGVYNRALSASEIQAQYNASRAKHANKEDGKSGQGLVLDGVNDYLGIPYSAALAPTNQITVEAWASRTNWTGIYVIVSKTESGGYEFYANSTNFMFILNRNSAYGRALIPLDSITAGWHHFIGTYDGRYMRLYQDGNLVATDDAGGSYPIGYTSSNSLIIGGEAASGTTPEPNYYFNGSIDEVAVYNHSLTAAEVADHYNADRAHHANWAPGKWEGAMAFDGVDDFVYAPVAGNVSTIEYWIYTNTDAGAVMDLDGSNRVMLNGLLMGNNATTYINGAQVDLSQYATGEELVQNGGFEGGWTDLGDGYFSPQGWTRSASTAYPSPEITIVNSGNKSLRLSAACCAEKQLYQSIPILQGNYYIYTLYGYGPQFRTYITNGFSAKQPNPLSGFEKYSIPFNAEATNGYLIITNPGTSMSHLRIDDVSVRQATSPVQKGVWTHVALVLDEPVSVTNVTIGKVGSRYLNGSIDGLRLWNRTLTAAEVAQHYYGSLNKYAPDKWLFRTAIQNFTAGNYSYMLYANNSLVPISLVAGRTMQASPINFFDPTPANASATYNSAITVNATFQTPSLSELKFNWNNTNYSFYNDSLVLAYNFEDISAIGDTAGNVVDVSRYGNNGTIYGNTMLLMHMNENSGSIAYDESRFANNGTCYEGATVTSCNHTAGKSGNGIGFNGVSQYVEIPNSPSVNLTGAFSLEAWVYPLAGDYRTILSKGYWTGDLSYSLRMPRDSEGTKFMFAIRSTANIIYSSSATMSNGAWHHLVGIYNLSQVCIYLNGQLSNCSNFYGTLATNNSIPLRIGRLSTGQGNTEYFNGSIDEVGIYNRSLSADEVLARYNTGKAHHDGWDANGTFGSAIKFDKVDDYVAAPTSFTGIDYTWSAWVNAAELSGNQHIIGGRRTGSSYWSTYGYGLSLENDQLNGFLATNGDTYFYQNMWVNYSSYLNMWTHLTLTWSNTSGCEGKLYVNGALAKALTHCMGSGGYAAETPYAYQFTMGRTYNGANFFNGSIDEVRVWNRALTADEIRQQYYGSLNKYDADKWVFSSTAQNLDSTNYSYYIYARDGSNGMNGTSDNRSLWLNNIIFRPTTLDNAAQYAIGANTTINATIQNINLGQMTLSENNVNTTFYNDSLVLAYNFDDVSAIGDTAGKVVDVSRYGNNGTVYGNTALLLHMDEGTGITAVDESRFANNGTLYSGSTACANAREIVTNGGMESASGGIATGWTTGGYGAGTITLSDAETENIFNGSRTQKIVFTDVVDHKRFTFFPTFKNSTTYRFQATYKTTTSTTFMGLVYLVGGGYTMLFSIAANGDGQWHSVNTSFTTPSNIIGTGTNSYIDVPRGYGNSTVYVDDISLTETCPTWTTGKSGTGLQFDGIDDYVSFPDSASLSPTDTITVAAWIKRAPSAVSDGFVVSKGQRYSLRVQPATSMFRIINSTGNDCDIYYANNLSDSNWHFMVGTYDKNAGTNNQRFYVDGVQIGQRNTTGTIQATTTLTIGRMSPTQDYWFNGTIDEVLIANRSLSAAEVLDLYNAGKAKHADWDPDGKWDGAMKFDGADDYVDITSSIASLASNTLGTISAWAKPSTLSQDAILVMYGNSGYNRQLLVKSENGKATFTIFDDDSSPYWILRTTNTVFSENTWTYITAVQNGTFPIIFVNGVAVPQSVVGGTGDGSWFNNITFNKAAIGRFSNSALTSRYFNGSIDEVRVWNRSLSAAEVQQQYYSSLNKYAPDKWLFTHTESYSPNRTNYYIHATSLAGVATVGETRQVSMDAVNFISPTLPNAVFQPAPASITVNATIENITLSAMTFGWNGTSTPMYDDSLVLAMNFDDNKAVGDTAAKVVDVSKYGNNGTIYGNTIGLWHFDEADNKTVFDESRFANNGTIYGNTLAVWHFDENAGSVAADASAYGNNGTISGATWNSTGKNGSGLNFDGVNDYILVPHSTSLDNIRSELTIEAWVKPIGTTSGSYEGIVQKNNGGDPSQGTAYGLVINYDDAYFRSFLSAEYSAGGRSVRSANAVPLNQWSHLVMTYNGNTNTTTLYFNGQYDNSNSDAKGRINVTTTEVYIGQRSGWYFNGTIDEVAIYNQTLTAAQVLEHYNAGKAKFVEWNSTGKSESALQFDGSRTFVNTTLSIPYTSMNAYGITYSAWVKTTKSAAQAIVYQDSGSGCGYMCLGGISIGSAGLSGKAMMQVYNNTDYVFASSSNTINNGQWHHVVGTYDSINKNISLFVDGQLSASKYVATVYSMPSKDVLIGAFSENSVVRGLPSGWFFNGTIDEVMIANRSLSAAEVLAQYNAGKAKHDGWDPNGKYASAMKFDGTNDYVNVTCSTNGPLDLTQNVTIATWVNRTGDGYTNYNMDGIAGANYWSMYSYGLIIHQLDDFSDTYPVFSVFNSTGNDLSVSGNINIANNQYYYLVGVFNGTNAQLYINGNLNVQRNYATTQQLSHCSNNAFFIGATYPPTYRFFNGSIDEVRIWNRSLSASEISQQYYSNLAKYDASKWLFTYNRPAVPAGTYNYFVYANESTYGNWFNETRSITVG